MAENKDVPYESSGSSTDVAEEHPPKPEVTSTDTQDVKTTDNAGRDEKKIDGDQVHDVEKGGMAGAEEEKADKPLSPMDPRSFPDGGLQAWLTVSGGFACLFCSFGWINAIGVFQTYYETHQLKNYSPSTIAWIPSLETFMMFAGGPVAGKIYDNYGPRYLLLAGTFFNVFGLMMTSIRYGHLPRTFEFLNLG